MGEKIMKKYGFGLSAVAFFAGLATANAQVPAPSNAFDGTYRFVSSANVNETYTARNGQMGRCPARRAGPLHVANSTARYTTTTGYKFRGTVGPQGELVMRVLAPNNSGGAQPLDMNVNGTIDATGAAHARQTSNSCSYDFVWQKASR
jgi:hypothetical protein